MDLITHIPGVANSALFTPGANTPSPWNVPITGATDGNSPASATRNMAEIYNRVLFALDALVQASGLPIDHTNWAQVVDALRSNGLSYAAGAGTANAQTVSYTPKVSALADGMVLWFKAAATNSGPATLNINALGALPIVGGAHAPLQGGEIVANGKCMVVWNAALNSFVLIECSGAALQVAAGTQSSHAVNLGQFASNLSTSGYQKLPGGLILQYGTVITSASADTAVVYPIAFPANAYSVVGTVGAGTSGVFFTTNGTNTNSFQANAISTGGRNALTCSWMAIGK